LGGLITGTRQQLDGWGHDEDGKRGGVDEGSPNLVVATPAITAATATRVDARPGLGRVTASSPIPTQARSRHTRPVVGAGAVGHASCDGANRGADDGAGVHLAVFLEVGVEHPRRQRLAELDGDRSTARTDGDARDPLGVRGCGEEGGRRPDVRRDQVRGAEVSFGDERGEEVAHRLR